MIAMNTPKHKFFERHLDNDLEGLKQYLIQKEKDLFNGKVPNIDSGYAQTIHGVHNFGDKYNIFQFHNASIHKLFKALRSMTIEACEYYGIDFDSQTYMIQGWFNTDGLINPELEKDSHYHDHLGGTGIPNFHGYYCVDAEPSSTFYKIGGYSGEPFENINKNNRAILSETGHPHGIGPWNSSRPRVTIAYDISPLETMSQDLEQHWVPLG